MLYLHCACRTLCEDRCVWFATRAGALAGYYDIPTLSLRNALSRMNLNTTAPDPFTFVPLYHDIHPGDAGHKAMADLAVHLIQSTVLDVILNPITEAEIRALATPVPGPMYQGGFAHL